MNTLNSYIYFLTRIAYLVFKKIYFLSYRWHSPVQLEGTEPNEISLHFNSSKICGISRETRKSQPLNCTAEYCKKVKWKHVEAVCREAITANPCSQAYVEWERFRMQGNSQKFRTCTHHWTSLDQRNYYTQRKGETGQQMVALVE